MHVKSKGKRLKGIAKEVDHRRKEAACSFGR
jgi:hypothetical protein